MNNIYGYIMIAAAFVNALSQIILKKSADETKGKSGLKNKFLNKKVIFAYGLFALVCLVNLIAYRGVDFKYGSIIQMIGQIFVILLARIFCKEALSKRKIISMILISVGIVVYNM